MDADEAKRSLRAAVEADRAADEARRIARAELRRTLADAREVLSIKECSAIVGVNASRISQLVREADAGVTAPTSETKKRAGAAGGRAKADRGR